MKRLLFLLMAVLTVGVMTGLVNAQVVLDIPVGTGNDAAEEHMADGATENNSSDLELGFEGSSSNDPLDLQLVGMRFNNITIPNGALIISAYIVFTVDETDTGVCNLTIFGDLSPDNPDEFLNADNELGNRPRTSAEVDWTNIPAWSSTGVKEQTPDISSIISEITSQAGWAAGNSLVLLVEPDADLGTLDKRVAESDEGGIAISPLLHVEYMPRTAWDPTPADTGWALIDLPLLEWQMPDPLVDGDTLSVDVYFGTDPNLIVGKNGTIQPVDGLVVVNTDQFGIPLTLNLNYYWRVDVIDPNGGNGDILITGETWSFTTVVPAGVVITESDDSTEVSEEGATSDTYTISLTKSPPSPVTVTIGPPTGVSVPIIASGDDAEEVVTTGEIRRSSSDLEMPYDGGDEQVTGLWFQEVQIPRGATITSAMVDFLADGSSSVDVYLTISGRLDDPGSFQQDINFMISTPGVDDETTAEVEWTPESWTDDVVYSTPDISAIIQEIVDQFTWSAGNNLAITIRNGNSGGTTASGERRRAESSNGSPAGGNDPAPVLRVEFDAGTQVTLSQNVVVLDGTNWEGVVVTVTAVDDLLAESDPHMITLENVVTSVDEAWNGLPADDVVVIISENECGAWGFDPMDLNNDCFVDIGDLAMFAADFGRCTEPFDVNCSNLSK